MEQVRRYELMRTIASGGMAEVYEAKVMGPAGVAQRVALKRALPHHAGDGPLRRMFFDEARLAGHLHHDNIVEVLDFGVVDDAGFIAMELIDGVDAGRAAVYAARSSQCIPEGVALHIVAEAAQALIYAHGQCDDEGWPLGIVHRDVSPQNILLSWQGVVKLADFGIAFADEREEITHPNVIKGKTRYMAPEQARGEEVTGAADVYALGATLQALIAGHDGLADHRGEIVSIAPELSPAVAELVFQCTQPKPGQRPDAGHVAERARRLAAHALTAPSSTAPSLTDGREALAAWLAPLRGLFEGESGSPLDLSMGQSLVRVGPREFTVSRYEPASEAPLPAASRRMPIGAASPGSRSVVEKQAVRAVPWGWWMVGATVVGLAVAWYVLTLL